MLEWIGNLDTAWIALIGTVFGGAGLKSLEVFLSRSSTKTDLATKLRDELRAQSTEQREEIRRLDKELDIQKERYFVLLREYLEIKHH